MIMDFMVTAWLQNRCYWLSSKHTLM